MTSTSGWSSTSIFFGELDDDGYPVAQDIDTRVTSVTLRRYTSTGPYLMTDYASGIVAVGVQGMTEVPMIED